MEIPSPELEPSRVSDSPPQLSLHCSDMPSTNPCRSKTTQVFSWQLLIAAFVWVLPLSTGPLMDFGPHYSSDGFLFKNLHFIWLSLQNNSDPKLHLYGWFRRESECVRLVPMMHCVCNVYECAVVLHQTHVTGTYCVPLHHLSLFSSSRNLQLAHLPLT
jgi:hypothetical protein